MTRAEAYEQIAKVMGEWWAHLEYTPEQVAEQFTQHGRNPKFADKTEMWSTCLGDAASPTGSRRHVMHWHRRRARSTS